MQKVYRINCPFCDRWMWDCTFNPIIGLSDLELTVTPKEKLTHIALSRKGGLIILQSEHVCALNDQETEVIPHD